MLTLCTAAAEAMANIIKTPLNRYSTIPPWVTRDCAKHSEYDYVVYGKRRRLKSSNVEQKIVKQNDETMRRWDTFLAKVLEVVKDGTQQEQGQR